MKYIPFLFLVLISSCGIIVNAKRAKYIESKGFDPNKDTSIIHPYQFFTKTKGYMPIYRELNPTNKLSVKISIAGYENSDSIPLSQLSQPMTFVLSDTNLVVEHGEFYFARPGYGHIIKFGKRLGDTCLCKKSFPKLNRKQSAKRKGDILFFWNVTVVKEGITYVIPSRYYHIQ